MAITYSTGPIPLYVAPYIASASGSITTITPVFLGTGETAPRRVIRRHKNPVKNDLAGPSVPFDLMEGGKEAFVSVVLTRWNWAVYDLIADPYSSQGNLPGNTPWGATGSLIGAEGRGHILYYQHPYANASAGHPAMIANRMPAGYRFLNATLEQDDDLEPGTQPNKLHLMWHCFQGYVPGNGGFTLFDYNMAGIPLVPPN